MTEPMAVPHGWRKLDAWVWCGVAGLLFVLFAWCQRQVVPAEDAVILFEYAKNLAEKGLITYGGASVPIEGATDFLWMVVIAALKKAGLDEYVASLLLNGAAAAVLLLITPGNLMRVVCLLGLLATPYLYASVLGFSALFFALGFVLLIACRKVPAQRFYLLALLVCLVRPDGVVWCLAAMGLRWAENWEALRGGGFESEMRAMAMCWVIPGGVYFCARWFYFGEILPLPFFVKAGGHRSWGLFFPESVQDVWLALFPVLLTALIWRRAKPAWWHLLLMVAVPACFYAAMRLEQNIGNRFVAPMFFGVSYWLAQQRAVRAALLFLVLSVSTSWHVTMLTLADVVRSSGENVLAISKALAPFPGRLLTTEAGRLTYYSGWSVHDSWGLNTPMFAKRPLLASDLTQMPYDLIVGHCDIALYQASQAWHVEASKNWDMQCRTMANRSMQGDYAVFLVPFIHEHASPQIARRVRRAELFASTPNGACKRYDVYALRKGFQHASQVADILRQRGAVPLQGVTQRVERDRVCEDTPLH